MKLFRKLFGASKRMVYLDDHKSNIGLIRDAMKDTADAINHPERTNDYEDIDGLSNEKKAFYLGRIKQVSILIIFIIFLAILNLIYFIMNSSLNDTLLAIGFIAFMTSILLKYRFMRYQLLAPKEGQCSAPT